MTTELEDYDNLIKQAGWLRLVDAVTAQWNHQIVHHTEAAVNVQDDVLALNRLRQVLAAQKAVLGVLEWPAERLRVLGGKPDPTAMQSPSRRGPL